jgi:hypothetical protein
LDLDLGIRDRTVEDFPTREFRSEVYPVAESSASLSVTVDVVLALTVGSDVLFG